MIIAMLSNWRKQSARLTALNFGRRRSIRILSSFVFCHGWGALDPHGYRAWIDHMVRRGAIVVWPNYQDSLRVPGAEFLPGLHTHRFNAIWRKGYDPDFEAYAVTAQHPGFAPFLATSGVKAVVVCGLATNICCFFAARDLKKAGFDPAEIEAGATAQVTKDALRKTTEEAVRRGVFGAPTFFVAEEMFFGQDRLGMLRATLAR